MKKLVFCLLFVGVVFSCENSDDSTPTPIDLNGKWELQSASCFCFNPEGFDFSAHKIIFNNDEGTIRIDNSTETFFIAASGSYDFQIQNNMVVINSTWEFIFELKGDTLTMSFVDNPEIADDEVTLTYKKID